MIHYKDRSPSDTIKIIKDFFNDMGFIIKKSTNNKINKSYWCHIDLYSQDGKLLLAKSNGKGITEELCEASAYGELYERYCGFLPDKLDEPLDNYNFEYESIEYLYELVKASNGGTIKTSCYQNIKNKDDIKFFSRELLNNLFGSTGFSCGNTLSEAILQATCELCERHAIVELIKNDGTYGYLIDTQEDGKLGLTYEIYDLSFDFKLPVIAVKIIDSKNYAIGYSFGCHPIREIAIERCITEFAQGTMIYMDRLYMPYSGLLPINYYDEDYKSNKNLNKIFSSGSGFIPADKFRNEASKEISDFWIKDENFINNNDDLLLFLLNNIEADIYITDTSICKDMSAVHVYSPQLVTKEQIDLFEYNDNMDMFKAEMAFNALLKEAIINKDLEKTMSMLKDALIDYKIRIYPIFYKHSTVSSQLENYLAALLGLYTQDFTLYNEAINKLRINNEATYAIYSAYGSDIKYDNLLKYII